MRVLVTGANGYIGTGVVKALENLNQDIIATDFSISDFDNSKIEGISADIFDIGEPYNYFHKPDIVLHLAWRNGFVHNSESHLEDFPKHYAFLSKMVESGIKKVVALGSMHEIGFWEGRIKEDTPCNPMSLYGISKNALRKALELKCGQKNVLFQWIRGYYIVGNSEKGASIFSKISAAEKEKKIEFPFTTGKNQYDFIDYDEFCNQIANVVINNNVLGTINCCSGYPETLANRVERFIRENNYKIKLKYGAFPDRPYDSLAVWGDTSKIRTILKENGDEKKC